MSYSAEQRIQELEDRFRVIAESTDSGLILCRVNDVISFCNTAALDIFGFREGLPAGFNMLQLLAPASVALFEQNRQKLLNSSFSEITSEYFIGQKKDGEEIPLRISFARWTDQGEIQLGYIIRDLIRDGMPFRNELFQREQMFRSLAEFSQDMIMQFDREHRHLYVNPVVKSFTGLDTEEVLGKTHEEMGVGAETAEFFRKAINRVFESKETLRLEVPVKRMGKWLHWQLVPEFDARGEVVSVMTSARDITELKRAEENITRMLEKERVGSSRVDLQACKLEYSIVSPK